MTPSHDSTLNRHLVLGSQFNVEFWPRVIIQRGILTRGYNSTWNSDPSTYLLLVELRLKKVSKFNSAIKIQQLRRVTIQRKIHWILTPGRYSIGGSKFYLTPATIYADDFFSCGMNYRPWCALHKRYFRHELSPATIHADAYGMNCRWRRFMPRASATIHAVTNRPI